MMTDIENVKKKLKKYCMLGLVLSAEALAILYYVTDFPLGRVIFIYQQY